MKNKIIIITGTTTSGKTNYSIELAKKVNGEIINCDSMQVYKEIPILSAQPTNAERQNVPHHLFGIISLAHHFSAGHWLKLAIKLIADIKARQKTPIIVGGTGLYIKLLIEGMTSTPEIPADVKKKIDSITNPYAKLLELDPKTANRLSANDLVRIKRALEVFYATGSPFSEIKNSNSVSFFKRSDFHIIQVIREREKIYDNINKRFLKMLDAGVIDECKKAYEQLGDINYPKAHGLPEIIRHINGELTLEEMISKSQQNTRNYAKRQLTFFKHQIDIDEFIEL